jgi:hypothetical protein
MSSARALDLQLLKYRLRLMENKNNESEFVPLRTLPSRLYAEMFKEALEKEGISCIIKGDDIGIMLGSYSTTSPVKITVWVPESQKEKAEEILNQMLNHI